MFRWVHRVFNAILSLFFNSVALWAKILLLYEEGIFHYWFYKVQQGWNENKPRISRLHTNSRMKKVHDACNNFLRKGKIRKRIALTVSRKFYREQWFFITNKNSSLDILRWDSTLFIRHEYVCNQLRSLISCTSTTSVFFLLLIFPLVFLFPASYFFCSFVRVVYEIVFIFLLLIVGDQHHESNILKYLREKKWTISNWSIQN